MNNLPNLPQKDAVNGLGLQPHERIRIIPAPVMNATSNSSPAVAAVLTSGENRTATVPGSRLDAPVAVVVDASLHDPAAWVETGEPMTQTQSAVKAQIADDFAAKIGAAARQLGTPADDIELAWKAAQEEAELQYRAMFGNQAFNSAAMLAAEAALAGK
ncbi:MAG: hypothetical protein NTV08_20330 [Verrucomicrobia bacterium]|nr:hypothetical protein [Verrucomicrobiota bacterium]